MKPATVKMGAAIAASVVALGAGIWAISLASEDGSQAVRGTEAQASPTSSTADSSTGAAETDGSDQGADSKSSGDKSSADDGVGETDEPQDGKNNAIGAAPKVPKAVRAPKPILAAINDPAAPQQGVQVQITSIESVKGTAQGPGEVDGPALRFTIRIDNNSADELDLSSSVFTVYYGKRATPAGELSGPGVDYLPSSVAAADSVMGRYVFRVPNSQRQSVRADFGYAANVAVVVFEGNPATVR